MNGNLEKTHRQYLFPVALYHSIALAHVQEYVDDRVRWGVSQEEEERYIVGAFVGYFFERRRNLTLATRFKEGREEVECRPASASACP